MAHIVFLEMKNHDDEVVFCCISGVVGVVNGIVVCGVGNDYALRFAYRDDRAAFWLVFAIDDAFLSLGQKTGASGDSWVVP